MDELLARELNLLHIVRRLRLWFAVCVTTCVVGVALSALHIWTGSWLAAVDGFTVGMCFCGAKSLYPELRELSTLLRVMRTFRAVFILASWHAAKGQS